LARLGSILTKETDMSKTKFGTFEGEIYYARVFADNMDNSEYHVATQGQYNCVFVPKDDNELDKIIKMGYPEVVLGNKMVKEYEAQYLEYLRVNSKPLLDAIREQGEISDETSNALTKATDTFSKTYSA